MDSQNEVTRYAGEIDVHIIGTPEVVYQFLDMIAHKGVSAMPKREDISVVKPEVVQEEKKAAVSSGVESTVQPSESGNPFDDVPSDIKDAFGALPVSEASKATFGEMKIAAKEWGLRNGGKYKNPREAVKAIYRKYGGSVDGSSKSVDPAKYDAVVKFFISNEPVEVE